MRCLYHFSNIFYLQGNILDKNKWTLFILRTAKQLGQNSLAHSFLMAKFQLLSKINIANFLNYSEFLICQKCMFIQIQRRGRMHLVIVAEHKILEKRS